jgi:hypothetical protein
MDKYVKFIFTVIVMSLMWSGNANAGLSANSKQSPVNDLIKQGYKLIDTDSVAYRSVSSGYSAGITGTFYHLMKDNDLVTCVRGNGLTNCWRP